MLLGRLIYCPPKSQQQPFLQVRKLAFVYRATVLCGIAGCVTAVSSPPPAAAPECVLQVADLPLGLTSDQNAAIECPLWAWLQARPLFTSSLSPRAPPHPAV